MSPEDRAINIRAEFSEFENLSAEELNKCCRMVCDEVLSACIMYEEDRRVSSRHLLYWYDVKKQFI